MSDSNTANIDTPPRRHYRVYYTIAGISAAVVIVAITLYIFVPNFFIPPVTVTGHATFLDSEYVLDGEVWRFSPDKLLFEDVSSGTVYSTRAIGEDGSYELTVPFGKTYNVIIGFWQFKILHACNAGQITIDTVSPSYVRDVQCHPLNDPLNRSDIDVSKY